jgi:hypothetical protein
MNEFQVKNATGEVVGTMFCKSVWCIASGAWKLEFETAPEVFFAGMLYLQNNWRIEKVTK